MWTIKDEHSTTWYFDKGDPVAPLVSTLQKAGFTTIVLPRQTIITGEVTPLDSALLDVSLKGLSILDRVDARVRKELIAKAEHQATAFLCRITLLQQT